MGFIYFLHWHIEHGSLYLSWVFFNVVLRSKLQFAILIISPWVKAWWGSPLWNTNDSFLRIQIHLFFHFSDELSYTSPFFLMSNEIILFQILYRHLEYLSFSLVKVEIVKIIQCGPCSIIGSKFLEISLFEFFYIAIGHLVLSHSYILCTLVLKVFVIRILGQKYLFRLSLWVLELFFLMTQNLGVFSKTW